MLKNKVIGSLNNSYAFNIIIIGKKNDVSKEIDKMYINYLSLNKIIEKDNRLIPNIKKYLLLFNGVK